MSKLNPKITIKNFSISIVIIFIILGVWWFINHRYQQKMIKLDACLESCVGGGTSDSFLERDATRRGCEAKCREKYGVTEEKYSKWKEKKK